MLWYGVIPNPVFAEEGFLVKFTMYIVVKIKNKKYNPIFLYLFFDSYKDFVAIK